MKIRIGAFVCFFITSISCSLAEGVTLIDTFGGGDTYDTNVIYQQNWFYEPPNPTVGRMVANQFTVGAQDYSLDSVTLALKRDYGTANNITISLRNDDGTGNKPSPGAAYATLATDPGNIDGTNQVLTYNSAHPTLYANTTYWITLEPTTENTTSHDNDCRIFWYASPNTSNSSAYRAYSSSTGGWAAEFSVSSGVHSGALRVEATAVPEPASFAFFGMGLAGLLGAGVKRFKKS